MIFKVGDTVVYPHHGAALIEAIETRTIKGEQKEYLVLKVAQGDLTVRVPADNAEYVGVRDVVGQEGLDKVFQVLRAPHTEEPTNWSRRYKANLEKLASGDVDSLPGWGARMASRIRTIILADVGHPPDDPNRFALRKIGIGLPVLHRAVAEVRGRPVAEPFPAELIMEQGLSEADGALCDVKNGMGPFACELWVSRASIVFIALGCYGWWEWLRRHGPDHRPLVVTRTTSVEWLGMGVAGAAVLASWTWWLATRTDSPAPFWDSAVLALSLVATYGQARKLLESWWLWILVDVISVPLYLSRGLVPTAAVYAVFGGLCVVGLREWSGALRRTTPRRRRSGTRVSRGSARSGG